MKTRKNRLIGPTVESVPRLAVYKPLAVLLAILLAPAFSWLEPAGTHASVRPFQARAQSLGCQSTTNTIIQNYCTPPVGDQPQENFSQDLVQLESDAVNAYLAAHNLPASDAHIIYDYGRADLRDAIRAYIISILLGVIATPALSRTGHQRLLYLWLQNLVQTNEIALYTAAYKHYLDWQKDPCNFQLDPMLAQAYGISYDGTPFCNNQLSNFFIGPPVPAPSYFIGYGLEQGYEQWGKHCPSTNSCGQLPILPDVSAKLSEVIGIAVDTAPVLATALASPLYANLSIAIEAWDAAVGSNKGGRAVDTDALISGSSVDELGGAEAAVSGPILIIVMAILIGVDVGFQTFSNQDMVNQLNDLNNQITAAENTPPDLSAFVNDTTGLGLFKLQNTLIAQTLRANADGTLTDQPSTTPLPAHQSGTDLNFQGLTGPISDTLSYEGWNAEIWSAKTWGGWFVQTCANGPKLDSQLTGTCAQPDSISADLNFFDWSFNQTIEQGLEQARFTASRFHDVDFEGNIRNKFTIVRTGGNLVNGQPLSGPVTLQDCPAGAGGVSPGPYVSSSSACWSYVGNQLPIVLGDGSRGQINLVDGVLPAFSGPTNLPFATGVASSQTINVNGSPAASGCVSSTTLPSDFSVGGKSLGQLQTFGCNFDYLSANPQVTFDGSTAVTPGNYSLSIQYTNSVGTTHQNYTINVTSELGFVSSGTMNVTAGLPATYTVVTTGNPRPKISVDPLYLPLMNGLTLQDNGDGTATISGTYNSIATQSCTNITPGPSGSNCGIIATIYNPDNSIKQQVEQQFAINPTPAPAATLVTTGAAFTAGAENQALLTATGGTTPVSWCFGDGSMGQFPLVCASNPPFPWLSLHDNGNGTATLTGTPPVGTTGPVSVNIVPGAADSVARSNAFTITLTNGPLVTSDNTATFTVGNNGSFTIAATEGTVSLPFSPLPSGLQFSPNGNTATISGIPAVHTGGQYLLAVQVDAGALGVTRQDLFLNVNEGAVITSPPVTTFFVGKPGTFTVTTTGFPTTASHPYPSSPGMHFDSSGLPPFLTASNLNPAGFSTGTLVISGTPQSTDVGTYALNPPLGASNGIGSAFENLSVRVLPLNPSSPVSLLPQVGARLVGTNIVLSVVLPNAGNSTAANVTVTSAKFTSGGATLTPSAIQPASGVSIPSASSATFNLVFPNTIGVTLQSLATYSIAVSYSGGSLNFAGRIGFM